MKLSHTEIRKGTIIVLKNDPYEVIDHSHSYKGRGSSVMQTRLRNLKDKTVMQKTFHAREEVEEADIERKNAVFIYAHKGTSVFSEEKDSKKRFEIPENMISEKIAYLKENTPVTVILFNGNIISISLPVKINLTVKESPPGIRGDRAQGGTKTVILETGLSIETPLFIKEGDIIEVNTDTGEYVRRIN